MIDAFSTAIAPHIYLCKCCGRPTGTQFYTHPYTGNTGADGVAWGAAASCLCDTCSAAIVNMTKLSEFNNYKADFEMRAVDEEGETELNATP